MSTIFTLLFLLFSIHPLLGEENNNSKIVQTGIYLLEVANLDLKDRQFFADFYIWFKVKSDLASWTPASIEFMNGQLDSPLVSASEKYPDGSTYFSARVKGKFRTPIDLRSYPFDQQELKIILEDSENSLRELTLVEDPQLNQSQSQSKWVQKGVGIPDWVISKKTILGDVHHYDSQFGQDAPEGIHYSRLTFSLTLDRIFIPHLIKFIIPLMVIAGMAYLVFFINASEFEAQCAICITSLLTAVALHISQADALPSVGYLVVSDRIFILFYILIFLALIQTVVVNNYAKRGDKGRAKKLDILARYLYPILMAGGVFGILHSI